MMRKFIIDKSDGMEIIRQYEYWRKPDLPVWDAKGKIIKNHHAEQMEQNTKVAMAKREIIRLNDVITWMLQKIKEYEHEWEYFEERRRCINAKFPMH